MEVRQLKKIQKIQKDQFSLQELCEHNFSCGELDFIWGESNKQPRPLLITGGFIDSSKRDSLKVYNPYQVMMAIATNTNPIVRVGQKNDLVEFEIDLEFQNFFLGKAIKKSLT